MTENIENIVSMIGTIIENGHAYASDGDVYFNVPSLDGYGQLSGRKMVGAAVSAPLCALPLALSVSSFSPPAVSGGLLPLLPLLTREGFTAYRMTTGRANAWQWTSARRTARISRCGRCGVKSPLQPVSEKLAA